MKAFKKPRFFWGEDMPIIHTFISSFAGFHTVYSHVVSGLKLWSTFQHELRTKVHVNSPQHHDPKDKKHGWFDEGVLKIMCFLQAIPRRKLELVSNLDFEGGWNGASWSPVVLCTIPATMKNSVEGEQWWRTFLMGVHFCSKRAVGWQVVTIQNLTILMNVMFPGVAYHMHSFILYRICTVYTVYWKFTCTLYSYLCCSYMSFCESWTSLCFFFAWCQRAWINPVAMLSHLNPWNTPWKLDQIHQGSVSHFKHGHQGDFQHLGLERSIFFWWAVDWIAIQ